jgi:hypothetical protein
MANTPTLIKDPYKKTVFKNQQELDDFMKCCDPDTGYLYFMDNFFMIQHPTKGSMNYHPWEFQERLIDTYHRYRFSISLMPRQSGKSTSAAGYLLWYQQGACFLFRKRRYDYSRTNFICHLGQNLCQDSSSD